MTTVAIRFSAFLALALALWTSAVLANPAETAAPGTPISWSQLNAQVDQEQPTAGPSLTQGRARLGAPLQALRAEVGPEGLDVDSTSESEGQERFRLVPVALAKGATPVAIGAGRVTIKDQAIILKRGVLSEVLTASSAGLRQDFVIAHPPPGDAPLTLTLALSGASAEQAGEDIALTLPGGRELLYHGLHITDADGQVLPGTLSRDNAQTLSIRVADAGARYPITIDPTITDADWSALGLGVDDLVYALAVFNSELYVGGDFTHAGGNEANHIAKWDGSTWSPLMSGGHNGVAGDGANYNNGSVRALAVFQNELYVGGWFRDAGGIAGADFIAKWDGTANNWEALDSGVRSTDPSNTAGTVFALAVSGNALYVGGAFNEASGTTVNHIAKWNGSSWSALDSGVSDGTTNSWVYALAVLNNDLYVGGNFNRAGSTPAKRIAKWDGTANNWSALSSGVSSGVRALAVSGSDLYVGGYFATAGGIQVNRIAKWNGGNWSTLGSGVNGGVFALAFSGDDLYVGGAFDKASGSPANRIAKWDSVNDSWSALGSGVSSNVYALAASGDDLYVGGAFTSAFNQVSNHVGGFIELPGQCGSSDGQTYTTAPSTNLCAVGSAGNVASGNTEYTWTCAGPNGGTDANCAATREYLVTPSAGANGSINPDTVQQVAYQATPQFTVTPNSGYTTDTSVGGDCPAGSWSSTTYTTGTITSNCTVSFSFSDTASPVNGACGSSNGDTFTTAPSSNLCTVGTPGSVSSNNTTYTWNCAGVSGGSPANCSATRHYTVTSSAGSNGTITPGGTQNVVYNTSLSFTVNPASNYTASVGGTCGGTLSGETYTTSPITANCTVSATFTLSGNTPGPTQPGNPGPPQSFLYFSR